MALIKLLDVEGSTDPEPVVQENFERLEDFIFGTSAAITASTTQAQGQQPLTERYNNVTTVAVAEDVVTLQAAAVGLIVYVFNNGANRLQIFPASGDDLGSGVDTSTSIAPGQSQVFQAFDATTWNTVLVLGPVYDATNYWTDTVAADGGRVLAGFGTDADFGIDLSGATDGDFSVNTDHLFVDTSTGNVGIGITAPLQRLHIAGVTAGEGLRIDESDGGNIAITVGAGASGGQIRVYNGGALDLFLSGTGDSYACLNTNFDFGIGTASPEAKLHVAASSVPTIRIDNLDTTLSDGQVLGTLQWYANDVSASGTGIAAYISAISEEDGSEGSSSGLAFGTANRNSTGAIERIRIDEHGNVGIGTTDPSAKLYISQASATGAIPALTLEQTDISEEEILFLGTAANGSANRTLVSASDFTTPGALTAWVKVAVTDAGSRIGGGSKTDLWFPLYAIPTA